MKQALLVMAKRPSPGQTKTRLTPPLSAQNAADLYQCFLRDALDLARSVPGITPFIAYAPVDASDFFRNFAPDFERVPQIGATLGNRLEAVLSYCSNNGYAKVCAMNSDSPTLPAAYLAQAFEQLDDESVDVVLGPCDDGGYYLIGWKRPYPTLVRNVKMSTSHVLQDTLAIADSLNLRVALLPVWYDVDSIAELERIQQDLRQSPDIAPHTRAFLRQLVIQKSSNLVIE